MIEKQVENIKSLIQLDIDAYHAYGTAIKETENSDVASTLREFQGDHERHVRELSDYLRENGEEPPEFSRDFKGYLIEGFTWIRSQSGTKGALEAMESNEETTNKHYDEAQYWNLDPDGTDIIERGFSDERRHLAYIQDALAARVWEEEKTEYRG